MTEETKQPPSLKYFRELLLEIEPIITEQSAREYREALYGVVDLVMSLLQAGFDVKERRAQALAVVQELTVERNAAELSLARIRRAASRVLELWLQEEEGMMQPSVQHMVQAAQALAQALEDADPTPPVKAKGGEWEDIKRGHREDVSIVPAPQEALEWDKHFDDSDNPYYEAASPYHDDGSAIMFRIRKALTAKGDVYWYMDHDSELMGAYEEEPHGFVRLADAQAKCERDRVEIIADVKASTTVHYKIPAVDRTMCKETIGRHTTASESWEHVNCDDCKAAAVGAGGGQ